MPPRYTPPPPPVQSRSPPPTPDHVTAIRENRLKAKAKIQQLAASRQQTQGESSNRTSAPVAAAIPNTREGPLSSRDALASAQRDVESAKRQKTSHGQDNAPLPRDKSLGQYIEFDLSKLHNSKGGFLVDEDDSVEGKLRTLEELSRKRERERERAKALQEPGMSLDPEKQFECRECGAKDLDDSTRRVFGIYVCKKCMRELPDKYSLLTKTEAKEDYLLTDSELRDPDLLPHLLKANPHKSTYSNMMLFLRCQVEEYAFSPQKWGSEAALDEEFERREEERTKKRGQKFAQKLADLRRRTRDNVWQKRQDAQHVHDYQPVLGGNSEGLQRCEGCGHQIEVEEF